MTQNQAVIETIEKLGGNATLSCHNVLILRREARMGGGKIHLRFASQRYIFAPLITILFFTFILAGCKPASDTLCGVPVTGSPWSFAASLHDQGDGSFLPAEVVILPHKAYIRGWFYQPDSARSVTSGGDGFQPAEVICDLDAGEVTHAFLVISEFIPK